MKKATCIVFFLCSNISGKGGVIMKRKRKIPIFFTSGSLMESQPEQIVTDPMGSYTGIPENPEETPVQDADDL